MPSPRRWTSCFCRSGFNRREKVLYSLCQIEPLFLERDLVSGQDGLMRLERDHRRLIAFQRPGGGLFARTDRVEKGEDRLIERRLGHVGPTSPGCLPCAISLV